MFQMLMYLRNWLAREEGQDLVEYGMLLALIALVAIVGVTALGGSINDFFGGVAGEVGMELGGGG